MSLPKLRKARENLVDAASAAAWTQWGSILSAPSEKPLAKAIVDPEALVLASIALSSRESRLWRICRIWANTGTSLLSVQRMKNVAAIFDAPVEDGLAEFARLAVTRGGDARWEKLMGPEIRDARGRVPAATPRLVSPAALMLRLRLGFGVGIKADVLAVLVGAAGASMTVQGIASATQYYGRAVRRAAEELHAAGFVNTRATAPLSYYLDLKDWSRVLGFDARNPPAWRHWVSIYSFVAALAAWVEDLEDASDIVAASEARDLMARHASALDVAGVKEMPASRYPGSTLLEPFGEMLVGYADFIQSVV